MTSIDAILNVHRERPDVLTASLRCAAVIGDHARAAGVDVRFTVIMDTPGETQTSLVESRLGQLGLNTRALEVESRDLGQARNHGISVTDRPYVAFLDGDDLWSHDWLSGALDVVRGPAGNPSANEVVVNAEYNVVFDERHVIEVSRNVDARRPIDTAMYGVANFSTSQVVAQRELVLRHPFPSRSPSDAFGHEDWEWSRLIAADGAVRHTAAGTVHFIRREANSGSLMQTLGMRLPRPNGLLMGDEKG